MKIYTLIHIKLKTKKDLLDRTGNSPEQTGKNRRTDIYLCITESNSCTPKTKHQKSTLLQYKITNQLQIKLPGFGLGEARLWWPLWIGSVMCCDVNMTHEKLPDLMWMWQVEEKEKDHRLIRATPSVQMLGMSEGMRHTAGKEQTGCLWVQVPDPCAWVRPTQSPGLNRVTHPQSPRRHHLPRPCTMTLV